MLNSEKISGFAFVILSANLALPLLAVISSPRP